MNFTGPGDTDSVDFRQKPSVYGVQRNLLIQLEINGSLQLVCHLLREYLGLTACGSTNTENTKHRLLFRRSRF